MKNLLYPLFIFSAIIPLFGEATVVDQDEIEIVQSLIQATQKNLYEQQMLLKLVVEFKQTRASFVAQPTNRRLATALVKTAMSISRQIEQEHLTHLFSSDFLTEIRFFNQVGQQQHLPCQ